MKKKLCRRCSVPLRVPMVGAYEFFAASIIVRRCEHCSRAFASFVQLQGYRVAPPPTNKIVFCEVPNRRSGAIKSLHTLRMSNLIRFKVGCAVAGARPQGIASASQVTRMLLLLSQAFR